MASTTSAGGSLNEQSLIDVFRHLDYRDIVRSRAVCRRWTAIIEASTLLHYIVWLGIHEKVDGDPSFPIQSSSERLKLLLEQENAWERFAPRQILSLCPSRDSFPSVRRCRDGLIETSLKYGHLGDHYRVDRLPSVLSETGYTLGPTASVAYMASAASHPNLDDEDIIIAAEQDLIVIRNRMNRDDGWEVELRLLSLSDPTQDHPQAVRPSIAAGYHYWPAGIADSDSAVSVHGNVLIVQWLHLEEELRKEFRVVKIWDWTTGELLCSADFLCSDGLRYAQASLLSESSFAVPTKQADQHIFESPLTAIHIRVFEFNSSPSDGRALPRLKHTLLLPATANRPDTVALRLFTNPLFPASPYRREARCSPFHSDDHSLCVLLVTGGIDPSTGGKGWSYLFVFHDTALLQSELGDSLQPVPWEVWGAPRAACIRGQRLSSSFTSRYSFEDFQYLVHGSRLLLVPAVNMRSTGRLGLGEVDWQARLLDFNPNRVRRFTRPDSWPPLPPHIHHPGAAGESDVVDIRSFASPRVDEGDSPSFTPHEPRLCRGLQTINPSENLHDVFDQDAVQADLPFLEVRDRRQYSDVHHTGFIDSERVILARLRDWPQQTPWSAREVDILVF